MRPVACTNTGGPVDGLGAAVRVGCSAGRVLLAGGRKDTEGAWKVAAERREGREGRAAEQVTTAAWRRVRRLAAAAGRHSCRASGRQGDAAPRPELLAWGQLAWACAPTASPTPNAEATAAIQGHSLPSYARGCSRLFGATGERGGWCRWRA